VCDGLLRRRVLLRRLIPACAGLLALALLGWMVYRELHKAQLYAAGQEAAAAGRWGEALVSFRALVEVDPRYRDARQQLEEVLDPAIAALPGGNDIAGEVALVRWLAATDDPRLPAVLDRCVVTIPAGSFLMGSPAGRADEQPQRTVYLDTFLLDRYEVSNAQYRRFLQSTGTKPPPYWTGDTYPPGQADSPAVGVRWEDAAAYCAWAGKRLPTEAEWERACRGDGGQLYPWGSSWEPWRANVDRGAGGEPARASAWEEAWALLQQPPSAGAPGLRPASLYPDGASSEGVLGMVGGAVEWVADYYNWAGYSGLADRNPVGLAPAWNHAVRGSSWYDPYGQAGRVADSSRCAARNSSHMAQDPRLGWRCASSVPGEP